MQIPKYITVINDTNKTFLSPQADGLKDVYPDCRLNGESTLEFSLPATSEKIDSLTPECRIWAGGRVYSLLVDDNIDTIRDENNKLWAKFMAVERWKDLETSFVEPSISNDPTIPNPADLAVIIVGGGSDLSGGRYPVGSAAHALYAVLSGTGWTLGTVDVTGVHDLETEKASRLELVKAIQNIWGGYIVWDSVNKVVHLRDGGKWQNYTGFQIRYKKNLQHITRTTSNRLVTKLYCFGHDDLDIATVNSGKKYITNNSFTPREYIGIYKNQDIYNAQELKEKSTAELALMCRPRYLYRVKAVDLRTLPEYSHEEFALGDMADIIDPDIGTAKTRIIRHKYNLFHPWKCELELGDPQERLIEQLKASFNTTGFIDNKFKGNGELSGYSIEDGTIAVKKIIADELVVGTTSIINNVVTTGYVNALGITADYVRANISITSPNITGGTVTGSTVRTAASGQSRLELSGAGINGYDSSNRLHGLSITTGFVDLYLYNHGEEQFSIYNSVPGIEFRVWSTRFLTSVGTSTSLYGNWNFSSASVTLPGYSQVGHTHSEYIKPYYGSSNYCYLDYGGADTITVRNSSGSIVGYLNIT